MAVHPDTSDVLASAVGAGLAFLEPVSNALCVVLVPADELGNGGFVQTNGARLFGSLERSFAQIVGRPLYLSPSAVVDFLLVVPFYRLDPGLLLDDYFILLSVG